MRMPSLSPLQLFGILMVMITMPVAAAQTKEEIKNKIEHKENGGYKQEIQSESVDGAGTRATTDLETDVSVKKDGTITRETVTEKKVDPKGLFNEQTRKTKEDVTQNPDGTESIERKTIVNGTTIEDSKTK